MMKIALGTILGVLMMNWLLPSATEKIINDFSTVVRSAQTRSSNQAFDAWIDQERKRIETASGDFGRFQRNEKCKADIEELRRFFVQRGSVNVQVPDSCTS